MQKVCGLGNKANLTINFAWPIHIRIPSIISMLPYSHSATITEFNVTERLFSAYRLVRLRRQSQGKVFTDVFEIICSTVCFHL